MSRRLIIRPEAEADLAEAAAWYERRATGLGGELITEIGSAIRRAGERPLAHRRLRNHPEVRRVLAHRFPYRILYVVRADALVVFGIIHTARHDRLWRGRLGPDG
jgi:plasmid stabilization system protein ParE